MTATVLILALLLLVPLAALILAPKGWRTLAGNAAMVGLVAVGEGLNYATGFNWRDVLPAEAAPWVVLAVNLGNIALRAVTTTPVGKPL